MSCDDNYTLAVDEAKVIARATRSLDTDLAKGLPLYHGGVPGLDRGGILRPGHSRDHNHPGCPWCEARARGESYGGDGPSQRHAVYITTDRAYARFHASLYGHGDLYEVEPVGLVYRSDEDPVPTWTCDEARIINVVQRAVLLTMRQRWEHFWSWAKREGLTKNEARMEFDGMLGGKEGFGSGYLPRAPRSPSSGTGDGT